MPIFEYKCAECGKVTEFLQNRTRRTKLRCLHCGSEELEKLFSVFSPGIKQGNSKRCRTCSDESCPHSES